MKEFFAKVWGLWFILSFIFVGLGVCSIVPFACCLVVGLIYIILT